MEADLDVSAAASRALNNIEKVLVDADVAEGQTLYDGLPGVLRIEMIEDEETLEPDVREIAAAIQIQHREDLSDLTVKLVSRDPGLRLRARAMGVMAAEHYDLARSRSVTKQNDRADSILEVNGSLWAALPMPVISSEQHQHITEHTLHKAALPDRAGFQYIVDQEGYVGRLGERDDHLLLQEFTDEFIDDLASLGLTEAEPRQICALDALLDVSSNVVLLRGASGTGKTVMAMVGLIHSLEIYENIVLVVKQESHDVVNHPELAGVRDAISWVGAKFNRTECSHLQMLIDDEQLEVRSVETLGGASLSNTLCIVDNIETYTPEDLKLIATRLAEGSKLIMVGDVNKVQIEDGSENPDGVSISDILLLNDKKSIDIKLTTVKRSKLVANLVS